MRSDAQANRERILAAAEAVFGAHGAQGSTEEVARRAGVGIATVFRHFPTKDALIEAALLRHFEHLLDQAVSLADSRDPFTAVRALVTTMVATGASKITLASLVRDRDDFPAAVTSTAEQLRAAVDTVLQRAQQAGGVRADVTVDQLYFLIRALAQANATQPPDPATMHGAVDVVLHGIAPGVGPEGGCRRAPAGSAVRRP